MTCSLPNPTKTRSADARSAGGIVGIGCDGAELEGNCDDFAEEPEIVAPLEIFKNSDKNFEYAGGDTETFLNKCKMAHSQNTFGNPPHKKGKLTAEDIRRGLELHKESKRNHESEDASPPMSMYV